jgi:hypothetical protein
MMCYPSRIQYDEQLLDRCLAWRKCMENTFLERNFESEKNLVASFNKSTHLLQTILHELLAPFVLF